MPSTLRQRIAQFIADDERSAAFNKYVDSLTKPKPKQPPADVEERREYKDNDPKEGSVDNK